MKIQILNMQESVVLLLQILRHGLSVKNRYLVAG